MPVDDVIKRIEAKSSGRTRFKGQEPFWDEMLVEEIKELRRFVWNEYCTYPENSAQSRNLLRRFPWLAEVDNSYP